MSRREGWVLAALALGAFTLSFVLGFSRLAGTPAPRLPGGATAPLDETARVGPQARLIVRYAWPDGTPSHQRVLSLPADLVGLTGPQIEALRPGWQVEEVSPDAVTVREACPERPGGFLGLAGGYVAVYEGEPSGCARLRELTEISESALPRFQWVELRQGLPFRDEQELFQLMEGLGDG